MWNENVLFIQHYRGSLETYLSREDDRRSIEHWDQYQKLTNRVYDNSITSWIVDFINYVGEPFARHVLQDAGKLDW